MIDLTFSLYDLEYFLLILMRVASFVFVAPFFSTQGVPNRVKVGLSVFIAYLLYRMVPESNVAISYNSILGYSLIVIKEVFTGLLIGYGAQICTTVLNMAGHISDMETGLSSVTLYDPSTRESITITGAYYQYGVTLMLLLSGMYQYILAALAETFKLIPVNGAIFSSENIVSALIIFLMDYMSIGFRIVLPVFCTMLLLNSILGILAKVSPQMNMFAVGMQLKILVGLSILFLTVGMMPKISDMLYSEVRKMITLFAEALQ